MTRYRELRGVVRHLLPVVRRGRMHSRDALGHGFWAVPWGPPGVCRWCGLPTGFPRRQWDPDCLLQYRATRGGAVAPKGPKVCETCEAPGEEVDHRVGIHHARQRGARAFVRTFLLENFRWLCRECHMRKSAEERGMLAGRESGP